MSGAKVTGMPMIPFQGQRTLRVTIVAYDSCILFLIWWLWRALATTLTLGGRSNMFGAKVAEMPVMTFQSQGTLGVTAVGYASCMLFLIWWL